MGCYSVTLPLPVQKTRKKLGFKKIMVYKIPPGGGGKPYLATGLKVEERKSEVEKHLAREHQKLTQTSDPEIQQEIRDRIKNLERELSDIKTER